MIITEQAIADAQAEADRLAAELAETERGAASWSGTLLEARAGELGRLGVQVRAAAVRVDELKAEREQQRAEQAARDEREEALLERLDAAVETLTTGRKRLVDAVTAAESALVDAIAAAAAHDADVAGFRAELAAHGLGDDEGFEHRTADLGRGGVRIRGVSWSGVDDGAVLTRAFRRAALAGLGRRRYDATWRHGVYGDVDRLDRSGVLADVPVPAGLDVPETPRVERARIEREKGELGPFLRSAAAERSLPGVES